MNKKLIILITSLFLVFFVEGSRAITCSVTTDCPGATIFKMSGLTDAHAELSSGSDYDYKVCCEGAGLGTSCSGTYDVIIKLSGATNAHAEKSTLNNYGIDVCISSTQALSMDCDYTTGTCADLGSGYTCLATISGDTNAHVADCVTDPYRIKVCCSAGEDDTPPAGGSVSYNEYETDTETIVAVDPGDDPETGIDSVQLYKREALLLGGNCGTFSGPVEEGAQDPSTISVTVAIESGKCYKFEYSVKNGIGLETTYTSEAILKVDTTPPAGGSVSYRDGYENDNTAEISVIEGGDAQTGILTAQLYKKTADIADGVCGLFGGWEAEGESTPGKTMVSVETVSDTCYMFEYRVTNGAGLTTSYTSASILKVDTTPPTTTDNSDNLPHGSPHTIELNCLDTSSGCNKIYYCVYNDGEAGCNPSLEGETIKLTCPFGSTCRKIIKYYSTDNLGNAETVHNSHVITMDTSLPTCTISDLPEHTTTDIHLEWESSDSGGYEIKSYDIYYYRTSASEDLTHWQTFDGSIKTAEFPTETDGSYSFLCKATNSIDVIGTYSSPVSTFVDKNPPIAEISDLPEWTNQTNLTISWLGDDGSGSGIDEYNVQYKIMQDTALIQDWTDWLTTKSSWNAYTDAENTNTYYFRVNAKDIFGQIGDYSQPKNITIDTLKPDCMVTSPEQVNAEANPFNISWSSDESGSGVQYYDIEISTNNLNWVDLGDSEGYHTTETLYTFDAINGLYYFRCRATDKANNIGNWSEAAITKVDLDPPDISLDYNSVVIEGNSLTVNAIIRDNFDIRSADFIYKGLVIDPADEIKNPGLWNIKWVIEEHDFGKHNFSLNVTDIHLNNKIEHHNFTVSYCTDGDTRNCGNNKGICAPGGTTTCTNGQWGPCLNEPQPQEEICDGLDNNCDGVVDGINQTCGTDYGICKSGKKICTNGQWSSCIGAIEPQTEICGDGIDNDCDGSTDEECSCIEGSTIECGSDTGVCRKGIQTCSGGRWGQCVGSVAPSEEKCNMLDDNCNGEIDENIDCARYFEIMCSNGVQDGIEEGVDCGEICQNPCSLFGIPATLVMAGIAILVVLFILIIIFKLRGKELTWEELRSRWSEAWSLS